MSLLFPPCLTMKSFYPFYVVLARKILFKYMLMILKKDFSLRSFLLRLFTGLVEYVCTDYHACMAGACKLKMHCSAGIVLSVQGGLGSSQCRASHTLT